MALLSPWFALLSLLSPLPTGTDRPLRRTPYVTFALIGINIVVYLLTLHDPNAAGRFGLTPKFPRPVQLFTCLFIHVGFWHLLWNMVFLGLFGPHVEDALGPITFTALYFGGGIAAGLLQMAISLMLLAHGQPLSAYAPLVGASGAISSILAPFAVRFHRSQIRMLWLPGLLLPGGWGRLEIPAVAGLLLWLAQNVCGALWSLWKPESGGTAYWAHMGGFAFGLVAAHLTDLLRDGRQEYRLQDARASAGHGQTLLSEAVQNYRAFLEQDPHNAAVRVELACALAQGGSPEGRAEAEAEMTRAVRRRVKQGDTTQAVAACAEARRLGLTLDLTSREALRLGGDAEDLSDLDTAVWLLRLVLSHFPDAPEDEMARFKLGRILLRTDRQEARLVLGRFLDLYPASAWAHQVRTLVRQTYT